MASEQTQGKRMGPGPIPEGLVSAKAPRQDYAWYAGYQVASGDGAVSGEKPGTEQHS